MGVPSGTRPFGPLPQTLVASRDPRSSDERGDASEQSDVPALPSGRLRGSGIGAGRLLEPVGTATTRWERLTVLGICTVESRVVPAGASVRLGGQLCYASSPAVRRALLGILATRRIRRLDLRGLTFIDLGGIDAVSDVLERIGPSRSPEVHLGTPARRLLELLTRMDAIEDPGPLAADGGSGAAALRAVSGRRRHARQAVGSTGA